MEIAILGWGSLIWNPGNLGIEKEKGKNIWHNTGPMLPIEFARISKDGRLTLVIVPGEKLVQTLYTISTFKEIDLVKLDLAVREGCGKDKIGSYFKKKDEFIPNNFKCKEEIKNWVMQNERIDAVIWTNLSEKYWYLNDNKEKIEVDKSDIISYLRNLPSDKQAISEQYVRKTPSSIDTIQRKIIEEVLGWTEID